MEYEHTHKPLKESEEVSNKRPESASLLYECAEKRTSC